AQPTENHGTLGFGVNMLDYGTIKGYDSSGLPTDDVDAKNLLITGSWAKRFSEKSPLMGGVNLKYLKSDLAGYKASAPMADLGLLYLVETGRLRGLRLGADYRNIGPAIKYDQSGSPLPRALVMGVGFTALGGNLALGFDTVSPKGDKAYIATGV